MLHKIQKIFRRHKMLLVSTIIVVASVLLILGLLIFGSPKPSKNGDDIPKETIIEDTTKADPPKVPDDTESDDSEETTAIDDTTSEEVSQDTEPPEGDSIKNEDKKPNIIEGNNYTKPVSPLDENNYDEIKLPSIPENLKDNFFLRYKDKGLNLSLKGDVLISFVFVDEPKSLWSEEEISSEKSSLSSACQTLNSDAASYDTTLNTKTLFFTASINYDIDTDTAVTWTQDITRALGYKSISDMSAKLQKQYDVDEVATVFFINRPGRDVTYRGATLRSLEFAVLYEDAGSFKHELMHLFGAVDYYYPDEVEQLAKQLFGNSVMHSGTIVDPFTAYLVGWTDTLSDSAKTFLEKTNHITTAYMNDAHNEESFTGYIENKVMTEGTYTGYLISGLPEGKGTMKYNTGSTYEGDWLGGERCGNGTLSNSKGTYTGAWQDDKMFGEGVYKYSDGSEYCGTFDNNRENGNGTKTWADGKTYTGAWSNGIIEGEGVMKYADGSVYTGNFYNERYNGKGKLSYADGSVYEGNWLNGKRHGTGTMKWTEGNSFTGEWMYNDCQDGTMVYANGDRYEGHFNNGKRYGKGTMYYANGDIYEGDWVSDEKEGKGKLTLADGTVYEGLFFSDEFFR